MKRKYFIIIVALLCIILVFQIDWSYIFRTATYIPKKEPNLQLETKDSKKDGKNDSWFYRDKNGIPVKWLRDSYHDGRPDKWSFFINIKGDGSIKLLSSRSR